MNFKPDKDGVPIREGYYVRMPSRQATIAAVNALLDDGASFHVRTSGVGSSDAVGSITVWDTRSLSILQQASAYRSSEGREDRGAWIKRFLRSLWGVCFA
ncbi:hypothetical protein LCGC14_2108860 [marine sediment metagenome]|uniref:Uncharacterized protein n=1 Tax=marine sediment metagenome TaxID=412755 RepID=A0A0F9EUT6_9ZZZZ